MIGIINYGSGNVFAIENVYKKLNIEYKIVESPEDMRLMDKLVLPGVGAFDEVMSLLLQSGLKQVLDEQVLEKSVPILGVCVGMQVMAKSSEEGKMAGFGWIDGIVKKFDATKMERKPFLPHLGWNSIEKKGEPEILDGVDSEFGFYFLHTYYFSCNNENDVVSFTNYGERFVSALNSRNIYGVQFHPEKSHTNGMNVFKNFAKL